MANLKSIVLDDAKLLNRYYDKRALSSLPQHSGQPFRFGQVQWADDLIEMIDGKPSVKPISATLASLQNVFHSNDAVFTYKNGEIFVRATIPSGTIAEGDSKQFSALGFLDNENELIAVCVTQPVWVYSDRSLVVEATIRTNIA
ncbi:hypothetical protein [Photobacterium leiognathi]|uniref:hypothetical protein n=1 Tax=Photobacterium leiognathi TaxID=553611 RepID=UPI0029820598|nr:hypothetical protein [Photobacterium leiognathi]